MYVVGICSAISTSNVPRQLRISCTDFGMGYTGTIGYAGAWSGMLVFDTLVFGLTVFRSMALHKITGSNLLTLMLRDGEWHYLSCYILGKPTEGNRINILWVSSDFKKRKGYLD